MPTLFPPTTFTPATRQKPKQLGWSDLDVILVTGNICIDAPNIDAAVTTRVPLEAGVQ